MVVFIVKHHRLPVLDVPLLGYCEVRVRLKVVKIGAVGPMVLICRQTNGMAWHTNVPFVEVCG